MEKIELKPCPFCGCKMEVVPYALGREAAIEKIADGTAESYIKRADMVSVFGIEWTRGFIEYVNAWRVINAN